MSRRPRLAAALAAVALLAAACSGDDDPASPPGTEQTPEDPVVVDAEERTPAGALPELQAVRVERVGGRSIFVDGTGRQVMLRGASFNALAALPTVHPDLTPTRPPTAQDWDAMAAQGFDAVRLEVSWSAIEPERGRYDDAYLARVRDAVAAAAARRLYVVVALHQEAWGPAVASPAGTRCPAGSQPALAGNGAPAWATRIEGADTCHRAGLPHTSPAVAAAFAALYEDRDGLRGAYAQVWRRLVAALADAPTVAGYELVAAPVAAGPDPAARYTDLLRASLAEVRAAETEAGAPRRPVLVAPLTGFPAPGSLPAEALALDDQLVLAPTLPAVGSGVDPEAVLATAADVAAARGWGLWVAGYGVARPDGESVSALERVEAALESRGVGGAFDEWRRWCGDPESIVTPGGQPPEEVSLLVDVLCPDDVDAGPNEGLAPVVGRARPRAAPGRLTGVTVSPGRLDLAGVIEDDLASATDLVVWVPGDDRPRVSGDAVAGVSLTRVPGGWYATIGLDDSPYSVDVR